MVEMPATLGRLLLDVAAQQHTRRYYPPPLVWQDALPAHGTEPTCIADSRSAVIHFVSSPGLGGALERAPSPVVPLSMWD